MIKIYRTIGTVLFHPPPNAEKGLPLNFGGLKHEDRPPEIPSRLFCQAHRQVVGQGCTVLLLDDLVQHLTDLGHGGSTNPD